MISSDNFSTDVLPNNGTMVESFRGINFTITIVKISLYQSDISIDTNGIEFTGNLTCLSQSNSQAQYSVIITTNDFYVQLLSLNPIMVEYLQPFSLIFLAAQLSDGISNEIVLYPVLSPTGQLLSAFTLENSSQIFAIDVRFASPRTAGNYIIPFRGNDIIVKVILQLPTITTISPSIGVLNGENVTIACIPSDPDIEMFWVYETTDGSRGSVTVTNVSVTRFLSDSPLLHRLVLPNATYSDAGTYRCVPQGPIGSVVSELTRLNVLPNVVNIGKSPNLLIPESNAINLPSEGSQYQITLSCYTTQGYENPVWTISSNGFLSRTLKERGTVLPGVNVSIIRSSLYLSVIDVEINNTEFTGNLICQPQNNTNFQYTIVITTSIFYFQPLTPISITVQYSQPVNLTFQVAENSNGTVNRFERLTVFQYDSDGNSVGKKLAERLEGSTQVYVLDLDQAGISTSGSYVIFFFDGIRQANATIGIIDVVQAKENCSITMIRGSFKHNRNRRRTTFRFSSDDDPKAKYKCKLDKRKFDDCTSPMVWKNLRRRKHTVTVRAICTDDEGKRLATARRKFRFIIP